MAGKKIVVTGADGFIGRNLLSYLEKSELNEIIKVTRSQSLSELERNLDGVTHVFHLAGANRPPSEIEFEKINIDYTRQVIEKVLQYSSDFQFIFTSSIQAQYDNPYGTSKREAEELVRKMGQSGKFIPYVYRLPNVFGKWGKPNYNSVVATFCYNIARNKPIRVDDPSHELPLVYIDDVVEQFGKHLTLKQVKTEVNPVYHLTVGELGNIIADFRSRRNNFRTPGFSDSLSRKLYATYLSYLPKDEFGKQAKLNTDDRGSLFELIKQEGFGQIFVSTTKPGVVRGNHFHNTKTEKFCVVQGNGIIRFRKLGTDEILEYPVSGDNPSIVDIPPGYTHNIENMGNDEMVTLFWASEIFDPEKPDTIFEEV